MSKCRRNLILIGFRWVLDPFWFKHAVWAKNEKAPLVNMFNQRGTHLKPKHLRLCLLANKRSRRNDQVRLYGDTDSMYHCTVFIIDATRQALLVAYHQWSHCSPSNPRLRTEVVAEQRELFPLLFLFQMLTLGFKHPVFGFQST